MRRRDALLVLVLGASYASRPAHVHARQARRIGYLIASRDSDFPKLHSALRDGLRELGHVDGRNVEIVVRSADGVSERFPALVDDLVREGVEVIFAANTAAALAARTGAPAIPLVFAGVGDPVGSKLVQSFARPGGNATGVAMLTPQLTPKRMELLHEAVPAMTRVAVLWNPGIEGHVVETKSLEEIARKLGLSLHPVPVQRAEDLPSAFATMAGARADGLVVLASPLHHRNLRQIAKLALAHRLPAVCEFSEFAEAGGLMVYGPSWPDMYRSAARHVAKILDGAKPADLPVEQPGRIDLVINASTARALGLDIPSSIALRAVVS